jgi:hypothetical protein
MQKRARVVGLAASILAVVMLGMTLLAGNRSIGFGHSISKSQQILFFSAAVLLCAVQMWMGRRQKRP